MDTYNIILLLFPGDFVLNIVKKCKSSVGRGGWWLRERPKERPGDDCAAVAVSPESIRLMLIAFA